MSSRVRNEPLALLLTPKWVALSVLVVVLTALMGLASTWQYHRAVQQIEAQKAVASQPAPIAELVPDGSAVPSSSLGRMAVVSGRYSGDAWVTGRQSPYGRPGVWLISAVDDGSGLLTPVLRGWLPDKTEPPSVGQVEVTGRVSSPENFYATVAPGAADELVSITQQRLAQVFQQPLRAGYVVLVGQDPALGPGDPVPVSAVFGVDDSVGFPWQNAGYAVQWLAFIGFVGFMYWRLFSDDLEDRRAASTAAAEHRAEV